jgi:hypothetical protein
MSAQGPEDKARLHEFFERKIRPVFVEHCYKCHGPKKQSGELRFDRRAAALKGDDDGPILVAGQPEQSRLIAALRYTGEHKMPPKGKLSAATIAEFATWIKHGAFWPEDKTMAISPEAKHWAFQPVRKPALPAVKHANWPANPVDFFVLAKLEEKGVTPNPPADRRTLLRRLKFDLLGLPPTYAEVVAFEADTTRQADVPHMKNRQISFQVTTRNSDNITARPA